jgi:hypothetical protein
MGIGLIRFIMDNILYLRRQGNIGHAYRRFTFKYIFIIDY